MDDFASETDSDYTSYWRDWVRIDEKISSIFFSAWLCAIILRHVLYTQVDILLVYRLSPLVVMASMFGGNRVNAGRG